jgi:hypothetical protein
VKWQRAHFQLWNTPEEIFIKSHRTAQIFIFLTITPITYIIMFYMYVSCFYKKASVELLLHTSHILIWW